MPGFASVTGIVGVPQCTPYNLPDTKSRAIPGLIYDAVDNYWGGGEFIYCVSNGVIRQFGLVVLTQTIVNNQVVYNATEVPNTGNLGRMLGVAMVPTTAAGQFIWVCVSGVVPVNCQASVGADSTFGIAAAGQGGANSAGKQILNARVVLAASQTVAKQGVANAGSVQLFVNNSSGFFAGVYLSGTGIAGGATVTDIDPSGTIITMSAAATAAVNGTVTATYNNATVFYNIAHLNRPFAQGAIT